MRTLYYSEDFSIERSCMVVYNPGQHIQVSAINEFSEKGAFGFLLHGYICLFIISESCWPFVVYVFLALKFRLTIVIFY